MYSKFILYMDLNCLNFYDYFKNMRTLLVKAQSNNKFAWKIKL